MTYLLLIYEFCKVGLFSIGGGMATIPFLMDLAKTRPWFTPDQLTDMIAIAESTPGPIGINMSTFAGFRAGGVLGGIIATFALVLPSVVVICIISKFMQKFRSSRLVDDAFYRLAPCLCRNDYRSHGTSINSISVSTPICGEQFLGINCSISAVSSCLLLFYWQLSF